MFSLIIVDNNCDTTIITASSLTFTSPVYYYVYDSAISLIINDFTST
jgi:hypothetical protein